MSAPSARVVCISRSLGAGGEAVGRGVAERIGFGYVDEEIVQRAAEKMDVRVDVVADAEQRTKLAGRLLQELTGSLAGSSIYVGTRCRRRGRGPRATTTAPSSSR